MRYKVQVTADGNSDAIQLFNGKYILDVYATTWGGTTSVKLQRSPDEVNWHDYQSGGADVAFTENGAIEIPGSGYYRMVATTYAGSSELFFRAQKLDITSV